MVYQNWLCRREPYSYYRIWFITFMSFHTRHFCRVGNSLCCITVYRHLLGLGAPTLRANKIELNWIIARRLSLTTSLVYVSIYFACIRCREGRRWSRSGRNISAGAWHTSNVLSPSVIINRETCAVQSTCSRTPAASSSTVYCQRSTVTFFTTAWPWLLTCWPHFVSAASSWHGLHP